MEDERVTKAKQMIEKMEKYDIDKLNEISNKTGISLITLNFWFNAIHNI